MGEPAVIVEGLWKRFGDKQAVAGVDLAVPQGSHFGLVGPNGAGKTTSLRMITGLLRPDAGRIRVDGLDVWPDPVPVKARIGILAEDEDLFGRLTAEELLYYQGLLRGMDRQTIRERSRDLLEVLGLADERRTLIVDFSHGMRKKVALAAALLHGPRVLFLDEPFEAIDPVSARAIRSLLERHRSLGGTVVMSSHVMELVASMCDRVAVIDAGRVVAAGSLEDVRGTDPTLEDAFVRLVGAPTAPTGELGWLGSSSG